MSEPILIARSSTAECFLLPSLVNRHGLITGATGSGKTVTLQTMAEGLSRIGVPVFMADVKGDLSGMSQAGRLSDKMAAILKERGLDTPAFAACQVTLWDVLGSTKHSTSRCWDARSAKRLGVRRVRHLVRPLRAARRSPRWRGPIGGEKRGAHRRFSHRP